MNFGHLRYTKATKNDLDWMGYDDLWNKEEEDGRRRGGGLGGRAAPQAGERVWGRGQSPLPQERSHSSFFILYHSIQMLIVFTAQRCALVKRKNGLFTHSRLRPSFVVSAAR